MPGKFLIDLTDPRFLIDANEDVVRFIRVVNPFCHSDVGSVLIELGKEIPGAHDYSPSYKSCAYVALHTDASRIFAIAYGQRSLAFRLPPDVHAEAIAEGGEPMPRIGAEWIGFAPWGGKGHPDWHERLTRWCRRAFDEASADEPRA